MQFHLNGFQPGNPEVSNATNDLAEKHASLPKELDVLIVGSGPAGLTLAAQLAAFPGIRTRIVEQKDGPIAKGQADGVSCRSMEMFNTFGFADRVLKEAYWVNETTFWKPKSGQPDVTERTGRIQDVEDGLSEMPHVILNQARVHDMYLEVMRNAPSRLVPNYSRQLIDLHVDNGATDYPVTVKLERLNGEHTGEIETVRARYVVGCDGARSAVRTAIGRALEGDSANQAWGVMDVLAVTNFPDIRLKTLIKSNSAGNIVIIPREGGYLVRLYIELDELGETERVRNKKITVDELVTAANRIFHPYSLDVKEVVWWSVYEIGQRLTDKFDNVPAGQIKTQLPCVFITGDACHTHSPKAGQGMNVSMGDSFNLGWKLISVLQGRAAPALLHSYSAERQLVAKDLIDFDREWAKIISAKPEETETRPGDEAPLFQKYFVEHGRYTAGLSVKYQTSDLTGATTWQHLATGFEIGTRFHSAPVIRLADGRPMHLGHTIKADTRWHIYAFSGDEDPSGERSNIRDLCTFLTTSSASPIRKFTPAGQDIDAVIDLRAVFQQYHRDLMVAKMPELLLPRKGRYGLIDYEKMFCADLKNAQDIFSVRGIDRQQGCILIVRPDQYVAHILPMDAYAELGDFFARFMV